MEFLVCIVEKMVDYTVAPIGRQLGYLIDYNSNVENLSKEVEKLKNTRHGVQGLVDAARRNVEVIRADVLKWLTDTEEIIAEVEKWNENVIVNKRCFNGWCPDWSWRYRISKAAKKKTFVIDKLQNDRSRTILDNSVSFPASPPGIEAILAGDFMVFRSTELTIEEIMKALKDDKINIIGLYGVGGVGKTTLVKQVGKRAKDEKLFDQVVMAVVSQPPDIKKIQEQIADMLGLKCSETTDFGRAGQLSKRLVNEKSILIIMDDVWARLDLAAVGIPFGNDHKGCKIILTTRSQDVCSAMGSQTKICLHALSEQESWALFRINAGTHVDTPRLNVVAREIAKRCGGLPIALVTVGRALVDKDLDEWKKAARKLKESKPTNEQDVDHEVFSCLRLSYDYLKGEESKACFLLCSLFPEDHDIEIEDLARYGMGQGLFQDVDTMEEARDSAHTTIKNLKASCLLLDGFDKDFVKMHDVVRHVAKTIASKDKHVLVRAGMGSKEWPNKETFEHELGISLMNNDIFELPLGLECPKLQILLLQNNTNLKEIPGDFFEGMKSLRVLDLNNTKVKPLPTSIRFLTSLRTLHLQRCILIDISPIGELKKLEILSLRHSSIEYLPEEIGQLTKLRLLDLRECKSLKTIPPNVVSSLSQLEELDMACSFAQWEVEEGTSTRSNASFAELQSLPRLTSLSIDIVDVECLSKHFSFPSLIRFDIVVWPTIDPCISRDEKSIATKLVLRKIKMPSSYGSTVWLEKIKELHLFKIEGIKNILPDIDDREGLNGLKSLRIIQDDEIECLINTKEWIPRVVFPSLEILSLNIIHSLKEMCIGLLPSGSFWELRHLEVDRCYNLLNVVPSNLLPRLQNLDKLWVNFCYALEEVFNLEGIVEEGHELLLLSTLSELCLCYLPQLMHIWKGPTRLLCLHNLKVVLVDRCTRLRYIFPLSLTQSLLQLEELKINSCNELEGIISKDKEEEVVAWKKGPQGFACFQHLRVVEVIRCNTLRNFFSSSIARGLPQIEELTICHCKSMEVVVTEEMEGEEAVDKIVFPQLKKMQLYDLPNLTSFCPGSFPFEWPSLKDPSVNCCFKMITFTAATSGFQSTPKLNTISVDGNYMYDGSDLNTIIRIYIKEKGKVCTCPTQNPLYNL